MISRRESWTYSISTCCGRCLLHHLRTIRASKNGSCGWSWRCVYRPYLARKNFPAPDATKLMSSQSDCMQLRNHWTWAMVQRSRYSSTDTRYGSIENAERVPTFAVAFHDMYFVAAPSLSGKFNCFTVNPAVHDARCAKVRTWFVYLAYADLLEPRMPRH